jgi:hypothetical protein
MARRFEADFSPFRIKNFDVVYANLRGQKINTRDLVHLKSDH